MISETTTNIPVMADLIHVQHTYATSVDLDLAPTNAFGNPFDGDGFDPVINIQPRSIKRAISASKIITTEPFGARIVSRENGL
jgi:hypothetical protein